jgi:hypothetical protein
VDKVTAWLVEKNQSSSRTEEVRNTLFLIYGGKSITKAPKQTLRAQLCSTNLTSWKKTSLAPSQASDYRRVRGPAGVVLEALLVCYRSQRDSYASLYDTFQEVVEKPPRAAQESPVRYLKVAEVGHQAVRTNDFLVLKVVTNLWRGISNQILPHIFSENCLLELKQNLRLRASMVV